MARLDISFTYGKEQIMKLKSLANKIMNRLHDEGFHVLYYNSISTSSIYIKLDYGVAHSITVRDHPGKKKYDYRFNVIKGLNKSYEESGRYYFPPKDIDLLIETVTQNRDAVVDKYGVDSYKRFMAKDKKKVGVEKGFWQYCKEYKVGD